MLMRGLAGIALLSLTLACSGESKRAESPDDAAGNMAAAAPPPRTDPPAPSSSAPASLEEQTPRSGGAEEAAAALRRYYEFIRAGDYDAAWELRWHGAADDAESKAAFAAHYERYADYRVQVGLPSRVSGAAGSLYVEIPVQIEGRTRDGEPFVSVGTVTMRRANEVPGATAAQKQWRVYSRD